MSPQRSQRPPQPPSEKLLMGRWRHQAGAIARNFFPVLYKDFWIKKTSPPRNFASIYKKRNPKSVENEKS